MNVNFKTYTIDGNEFSNIKEFYEHVGSVLIPDVTWGHNLDAFRDILCGGFGTPDEGFNLIWKNSDLSVQNLGDYNFNSIIEIIEEYEIGKYDDGYHIILSLK